MTLALGSGTVTIKARTTRDSICSVEVRSERPRGVQRLFHGRRPEEVSLLAGQIYSLCGVAQAYAARRALAAAQDQPLTEGDIVTATRGVLAERVFETLRSLALNWPGNAVTDLKSAAILRTAMSACQSLSRPAGLQDSDDRVQAFESLRIAADEFGIPEEVGVAPRPGSLAAALIAETDTDCAYFGALPDCLGPADDAEVIAAIGSDPEGFPAHPALKGRTIETGAFARHADNASGRTHLSARLAARFIDIRASLAALADTLAGRSPGIEITASGRAGARTGYGAVECARGRLYHRVELDGAGQVGDYRVLAPTEWNFHPSGPFAAALIGARAERSTDVAASIGRLTALFDPCVAFEIDVREAHHA